MNPTAPPPKKARWSWRSQAFRGVIYQILALAVIVAAGWFLVHNTLTNMRVRGIQSGFDFLAQPAGFDIGEHLFNYESGDPYWRAFLTGLFNTLRVAVLGIVLTTVLGTAIGVGRFSRNGLVRGLCQAYVELFRNIPVLIQLLTWYLVLTEVLPSITEAWHVGPFFLSKGGLSFPMPIWGRGQAFAGVGLLAGVALVFVYHRWARGRFAATGNAPSFFLVPLALVIGGTLLGWLVGGAPTAFDVPKRGDFAIENGGSLSPEFLAVLIGLTLYTASYVSEVVRGGIESVARGQGEAAAALGLNRGQEMRLVMMPQAMRVIIPPMTNQYLNLTKNSSLAVAIGYPDLVSVANTAINQTGRAVECISIVMLVYLFLSLTTSMLMNWYNARMAIKER